MPTVAELTDLYTNFMLNPAPAPGACDACLDFTDRYPRCVHCVGVRPWLGAIAPISYSVSGGQLHHALAGYKRLRGAVAERLQVELAAVLWRFLTEHERCVARAARVDAFDTVTTVPSGDRERDERHPLRRIVGEIAAPTRERYQRLLMRSEAPVEARAFSTRKYSATRGLDGEAVLLVDDTWTTGANARSAAAALRDAGAGAVALVVIGRHVNRDWRGNDARLQALPRPFDWSTCARHARERAP
jgi:predicted amidophosphoribosyltransferase